MTRFDTTNVETARQPADHRMKSHTNRDLRESERGTPKNRQQEERTMRRAGVMYRGTESMEDLAL
jgi:hypothetical protein